MTKDQIIAMAIEAGIVNKWARNDPCWSVDDADLERFASLVAAQAAAEEREECAKVCDAGMDHSTEERMKSKSVQLNGVDGELEALKFWSTVSLYNNARRLCAVAIRERK